MPAGVVLFGERGENRELRKRVTLITTKPVELWIAGEALPAVPAQFS
jgi:hypothetical protein